MVLHLKVWESRTLPGLPSSEEKAFNRIHESKYRSAGGSQIAGVAISAGWSSLVARQAHNLKVIGSNPIPATTDGLTPRPKAGALAILASGSANARICGRSP